MATAKDLKLRLRAHVEMRMRDVRAGYGDKAYYSHIAHGAIYAANVIDAISDQERDAYLAEIRPQRSAA